MLCLTPKTVFSSHVLGGEITWKCQGGQYVFELITYRDCNGANINTVSETIKVWNHPTLTNITLPFVSRTDISPICTATPAGPGPFICGGGAMTGNGIGSIEKILYRSAPIAISGTPPSNAWVFTFDNSTRSNTIINLVNPGTNGTTIIAKMFANNQLSSCVDSSPQFLEEPYFVSCAGENFKYNMNVADPDLDSIHIFFSQPWDDLAGGSYNGTTNPAPLPFETGFSINSPTPDASFNAANVAANIDAQSGELTFVSQTIGGFVVKITVQSFRNGILISSIERDIQLVVVPCNNQNNAPIITGPFAGLFETTVDAGTLVNFNINSTDIEVLQDGSPQSNYLNSSSLQYGTNHTSALGCANAPCATLNQNTPIIGIQGSMANFNWQTACNHTENQYGVVQDTVTYQFVFKVSDDYCQVPKVTYATVTINVRNPGFLNAPNIDCIQSDATGNLTFNWTPPLDPDGGFVAYNLYSVQSGLEGTYPALATNTAGLPNPMVAKDYYLTIVSGCNGTTEDYSDTVKNIYLQLFNPMNGTAVLNWNAPKIPPRASMATSYMIMREYPTGTWTQIGTVPYSTTSFIDTIDVCSAFLNYQIVLQNAPCNFTSNIVGDNLEDMFTPDRPEIYSVSIDPVTGDVTITWNQNEQDDTYGYVIYYMNNAGIIVEIDTVFGIGNTSYTYSTNTSMGPLTYSVSAFDSCFTNTVPPTYQTSAKAELHSSNFLTGSLDVCSGKVKLTWTGYQGWNDLSEYEIFSSLNGAAFISEGTTTNIFYTVNAQALQNYCYLIRAKNDRGFFAYSNKFCLTIKAPSQTSTNYVSTASVEQNGILIKHLAQVTSGVTEIIFQREKTNGTFEEIDRQSPNGTLTTFLDEDVTPNAKSYTYRVVLIDSCGNEGGISNEATTIHLNILTDKVKMINYLDWSPYQGFDGSILHYAIFRGIDGNYDSSPFITVNSSQLNYTDSVENIYNEGLICYFVQAFESFNQYGIREISNSNAVCSSLDPLIYIPNAFTPGGLNPIFIPVVSLYQISSYQFVIFDRWGQTIFQTNDPTEGWDGTIKGVETKEGTYVYMLSVRNGRFDEIVKRGHVTLLRD